MRQCAHLQCDKPVRAKQLCSGHYAAMMRGVSIAWPLGFRHKNQGRYCRVPGCPSDARSRGYCRAHYARVLRHGEPGEAVVKLVTKWTGRPGLTTAGLELRFHNGATLQQVADEFLIHPKVIVAWLARIDRHDLLRMAAA